MYRSQSVIFNVNINTNTPLVVAIIFVFEIFATPNAELTVFFQVKWDAKICEDKLVGVRLIHPRHRIPQSRQVFEVLRPWVDDIVSLVSDNDV